MKCHILTYLFGKVMYNFPSKWKTIFPEEKKDFTSVIFLERPSFLNTLKKQTWFLVQCNGKMMLSCVRYFLFFHQMIALQKL